MTIRILFRLRRFVSLPVDQQWGGLIALARLTLIAAGLRLVSFRRLAATLRYLAAVGRPAPPDPADLQSQIGRILWRAQFAAGHCPLRTRCLARSLTLWWLLQNAGIKVELRIGVRRAEGEFKSHAWVEYQDIALNDGLDVREQYIPLEGAWWGQANRS